MNYKQYVDTIKGLKDSGVPKDQALDCLEFDSDEYPDMNELKLALNEVYGA